jgi:hypothetical protein
VLYDKKVEKYLQDLIHLLYNEEYFGFRESAHQYVDTLIDTINSEIQLMPKKLRPIILANTAKNCFM